MEVVEGAAHVSKCVDYDRALGPCSAAWVTEQLEVVWGWGATVGGVLRGAPDLAQPEEVAPVGVLAEVADDVGLLASDCAPFPVAEKSRERPSPTRPAT